MNNKDNNLKYKHKYVMLKNQSGGIVSFDKNFTKCEDDDNEPKHDTNYSYYNPDENQCCKSYRDGIYIDCKQIIHTVDRTRIPSVRSLEKNVYDFPTMSGDGSPIIYTGLNFTNENDINFYMSFIRRHDNLEFKLLPDATIYSNIDTVILKYENNTDGRKTYIAVKYARGYKNLNKDLKIIDIITKNKNKCSELLVKYIVHIDINNYKCIIMEYAIGTIVELIPKITPQNKILIDILYAVAIAIKCLYDIGLYYTGIRAKNILLRDNHNGGIQIILSQLDRITDKDTPVTNEYGSINNIYGSTPYEVNSSHNPNIDDSDKFKKHVILWNFGILICELLKISTSTFNYNSFYDQTKYDWWSRDNANLSYEEYFKDELDNIINKCKKKYDNICPLIEKLLCVYTDRWNLEQIINFLNKLRNNNLVDERRFRKEKNKERKQVASEAKVRKTNEREVKERLEKERQEKERLEKERQEKERQEKEKLEILKKEQQKRAISEEKQAYYKLNDIITGTTNSVTTSDFSPTCKILITCDNLENLKKQKNKIILVKDKKNKLYQDIDIIIKGRFMNNKKLQEK
jgi:hypothetical protein